MSPFHLKNFRRFDRKCQNGLIQAKGILAGGSGPYGHRALCIYKNQKNKNTLKTAAAASQWQNVKNEMVHR
jgi:hypothetical protein